MGFVVAYERTKEFEFTLFCHAGCVMLRKLWRIVQVSTFVDEANFIGRVVLCGKIWVALSRVVHRWLRTKRMFWYV